MSAEASQPKTLKELSTMISESIGDSTRFQLLNTRLIIQLGVNLKNISETQNRDEHLLKSVFGALKRMGIQTSGVSR